MVKGGQKVLKVPRQAGGVAVAGHVDGGAHFHRDRGGKVFDAGLVLLQDAHDGGAAFGGRCRGPQREGGLGGGDGGVGVLFRAKGDDGAGFLGRGVDDRAIARCCTVF